MTNLSQLSGFASVENTGRLWAISSPFGDTDHLNAIHRMIWEDFKPEDKIIYLGNYLGTYTKETSKLTTIDSIQLFKRALIKHKGLRQQDIVCLKGLQENLWCKLLRVQFAPNPGDVLTWLVKNGVDHILNHYGTSGAEGLAAHRSGSSLLIKWISSIRKYMHEHTGHDLFYKDLKKAAYTADTKNRLLFIPTGLNPNRPIAFQDDSLYWDGIGFDTIAAQQNQTYADFKYIIRGYDPARKGLQTKGSTISLDNTLGRIPCAVFSQNGRLLNIIE